MSMVDRIEDILSKALNEAEIYVMNPHNDGKHFEAVVISPNFEGIPLVRQHQLVMNALKKELAEDVHALALKTFTPEKWEPVRESYLARMR